MSKLFIDKTKNPAIQRRRRTELFLKRLKNSAEYLYKAHHLFECDLISKQIEVAMAAIDEAAEIAINKHKEENNQ